MNLEKLVMIESTRVTTGAAYQMRLWPEDWCPEDCSDLLETYVFDDNRTQGK